MNLSIPQLIGLAQGAGFSGDDLATAVAVALAESGGNPQAYNPETAAGAAAGHGSFGLWQIYITAHPELAGQNLLDPQTNAAAAFLVYSQAGDSFRPWSTYKNGAYQAHLDAVNQILTPAPDVVASADDGSAPPDGGTPPDNSSLIGMALFGGLVLWAFFRGFGG